MVYEAADGSVCHAGPTRAACPRPLRPDELACRLGLNPLDARYVLR